MPLGTNDSNKKERKIKNCTQSWHTLIAKVRSDLNAGVLRPHHKAGLLGVCVPARAGVLERVFVYQGGYLAGSLNELQREAFLGVPSNVTVL